MEDQDPTGEANELGAKQGPEAPPTAPSIYDSPEYLKMQARYAALAHAVSIANTPQGSDIVGNAEKFAAFLLG